MKEPLRKKQFFIAILFACVFAALLAANNAIPLHQTTATTPATYIETVLPPAEISNNYKNDPYVRIHPSTVLYPAIRFVESLQHSPFSDLRFLLGRKRIAELLEWGETIPSNSISIHQDPQKTAQELNSKRRAGWKTYLTLQTTWESLLSDYMHECEYATDTQNQHLDQAWYLESILFAVRRDERLLLGRIENSALAITNRQYIYAISHATFSYCKQRLDSIGYATDEYRQNYLTPPTTSGHLTPYITTQSVPYATSIRLSANNANHTTRLREGNSAWQSTEPLPIKSDDRTINTRIGAEPITQQNEWTKKINHGTAINETSVTVPQDIRATRLLVTISDIPPSTKAIQIRKDSKLFNPVQNMYSNHTEFFPAYHLHTYKTPYKMVLYELPNERVDRVYVKLIQSPPNTAVANISITALYRPPILLAGTIHPIPHEGLITTTRKWFSQNSMALIIADFLIVVVLCAIYIRSVRQVLAQIWGHIFSRKNVFTYVVPTTILLIAADVTLTSKNIPIYRYVLVPFGIALYVLKPSGKTISQHIGLLFGLSLLGYLAKLPAAETLFRWSYLYMCFAFFFHSYNNTKSGSKSHLHDPLWYRQYMAIDRHIRRAYNKIFHVPVKKPSDFLHNTLIAFFVILASISLVLLVRKLNSIATNYNRIPSISAVEPQTIYPGTVVVIKGKSFGWNTDQNSRIMSVYGDMNILDWKDTRVVFQIPAAMRSGTMQIQIAKYDVWFNEVKLLTSEPASINVTATKQK